MPRPISWLPRLHEIRKAVAKSVRSHYDRRELEALFQLQPRAAQKLIEMLPGTQIGTSRLVEREALASFLDRVNDADNTNGLFEAIRSEKMRAAPKKLRSLVRRDTEPVTLASLPGSIRLTPGRLEVSFTTTEQLAEAMYAISRLLESEGDSFARSFELAAPVVESNDATELRRLFAELRRAEAARAS